jgi:hypothetical protein
MTEIHFNDDRVENLGQALVERIREFQRVHHHDQVSVATANAEVLSALCNVLGYEAASIECASLRRSFVRTTRAYVNGALRHAVTNPVRRNRPSDNDAVVGSVH